MKICRNISPVDTCCSLKTTVTLGTFDGVHIGHRYILGKVIAHAEKSGAESAVATFDRHPASVIDPAGTPPLLTTLDEKLGIFEKIGIDLVYVITFTEEMSRLTAERFVKEYLLDSLGMSHFIVGYDHGFGKDRRGSSKVLNELARKYDFTLEIQNPVIHDGIIVNSSTIRTNIKEGRVDLASELLGEDYSFRGKVVRGHGIGKKLGVPTANIAPLDAEKIIPSEGVYAGWIRVGKESRHALICIGTRPTFDDYRVSIEVHIPDYDETLYGKAVRIGFTRRLRNIEKFDSPDALVRQIRRDIEMLKQPIPL